MYNSKRGVGRCPWLRPLGSVVVGCGQVIPQCLTPPLGKNIGVGLFLVCLQTTLCQKMTNMEESPFNGECENAGAAGNTETVNTATLDPTPEAQRWTMEDKRAQLASRYDVRGERRNRHLQTCRHDVTPRVVAHSIRRNSTERRQSVEQKELNMKQQADCTARKDSDPNRSPATTVRHGDTSGENAAPDTMQWKHVAAWTPLTLGDRVAVPKRNFLFRMWQKMFRLGQSLVLLPLVHPAKLAWTWMQADLRCYRTNHRRKV